MVQQRRDNQAAAAKRAEEEKPAKEYGMVAVSLGDGFNNIFKDLTVDSIVEGGQTMNPSIEDLSEAIEKTRAKTVFVLPNNGNVILAAQQAAQLAEDKKVVVIPTKNVAMGIAAAIAFQPDQGVEENAAAMEEAAQRVRTGTVTYAVRDTDIDDLHINEGDIIGLYNGAIHTVGNNVHDVTRDLMKAIVTDDDELITVYYGKDTAEEDAQALTDELAELYGDCDVEMQMGGQPLYYYLVSVE
jgi:dihydroxyacetone kinase-like predicted kinase